MMSSTIDRGRMLGAAGAIMLAALLVGLCMAVWPGQSATAQEDGDALPTAAFVAQAGDFADALTASSIAGQLGAPLFLTPSDELVGDTSDALQAVEPDLVVLAGGSAALSDGVEQQVREAVPDADVQRRGGANRMETAVLLADLAEELGFDRPVLTGATVDGVAGVSGLEVDGTDVSSAIDELSGRVDEVESNADDGNGNGADSELADRVDALEDTMGDAQSEIDSLESTVADQADTIADLEGQLADTEGELTDADSRIAELETTLEGVSREEREIGDGGEDDDGIRDTLVFEGMNVQLVNGGEDGQTDSANGLGNLIVGYTAGSGARNGSHNMVIGDGHEWTSFGGIVAGRDNAITGEWSSVVGGEQNTASDVFATVVGGAMNEATARGSAVLGGTANIVAGAGFGGAGATISGGILNTATESYASVFGGYDNEASGNSSVVSGGADNSATGERSSISGGEGNIAEGVHSSILGGQAETATASHEIHPGASD